jgi:RNA recognition motif-containing protein
MFFIARQFLFVDQSKDSIKTVFEEFGTVSDVYLPTDRDTGKGRGFGFVSMPDEAAATKAIEELDNSVVGGRTVYVNVAGGEPRKKKRRKSPLSPVCCICVRLLLCPFLKVALPSSSLQSCASCTK